VQVRFTEVLRSPVVRQVALTEEAKGAAYS
jgi:hypothetical protein